MKPPRRPVAWVRRLLSWYQGAQRVLPWRGEPDPYAVLVSEFMLQQTQVNTVLPYFHRFMAAFPSAAALARAHTQDVLRLWEGLGYYGRARRLQAAARCIVEAHGGRVPADPEALRALPGVGSYTAAAVGSICFGHAVPVVDGNVLRVFARFWGVDRDVGRADVRKEIAQRLAVPVQQVSPGDFNQAMMELGALVCRPRSPQCGQCPLRRECVALRTGKVDVLPVKAAARQVPHHDIAVGVVRRRGRVLIVQRRADQMLGGLWEFPGGPAGPGEKLETAFRRTLCEQTGLQADARQRLCEVRHAFSHFTITLHVYACTAPRGRTRLKGRAAAAWAPVSELSGYPFSAAGRKVVLWLERESRGSTPRRAKKS